MESRATSRAILDALILLVRRFDEWVVVCVCVVVRVRERERDRERGRVGVG